MTAGSRGLGQGLVAQSQREGALRAGRGGTTHRITPSVGTCWSVRLGRRERMSHGRGTLGAAVVKEKDWTKMLWPRFWSLL